MPMRLPPRACSKWRINDVGRRRAHRPYRGNAYALHTARGSSSRRRRQARFAVATTYRMSKPYAASGHGTTVLTQAEAAHPATTASNRPLQQPNAAPVRACVGPCRFSRPWYAQIRPWPSLLNGRSLARDTSDDQTLAPLRTLPWAFAAVLNFAVLSMNPLA